MNQDLRGAVPNTALAALDCAGEFLDPAGFETNVFPSLIKRLLDLVGHVDDLRSWDYVIPAMNKPIKDLVKPKAVFGLTIIIQIPDLASVEDLTFAT
jgi:hypothetical protein